MASPWQRDRANGKRLRRTTPPDGRPRSLADLPDESLLLASTFLPEPSVALLAAALTAPSKSWRKGRGRRPSATGRSLIAPKSSPGRWEVLDFEDVGTRLSKKLDDDDVFALLTCIDAKKNVKRLKLAGCFNITGVGLEALRGSVVIEQIDLSLAKRHEFPLFGFKPRISWDEVVPILDSIVSKDENSLRHLQFPKKWEDPTSDVFVEFVETYCRMLDERPFECANCDGRGVCDATVENWGAIFESIAMITHGHPGSKGLQDFTCYSCLKNYCLQEHYDGESYTCYCENCHRRFCERCTPLVTCQCGAELFCPGCTNFTCKECNAGYCFTCHPVCDRCEKNVCWHECDNASFYACSGKDCEKKNCSSCVNTNNVSKCNMCRKASCFDCRFAEYRQARSNEEQYCPGCASEVLKGLRQYEEDLEGIANQDSNSRG
ncbi:hypothetical protein ACHAWF_010381 [Thalassiosira exigua]